VGPEPKVPREMILFWNQSDPIDPTQLVSATHLPPVLCPQFIDGKPFTFRLLREIVRNPQNGGHASNYRHQSASLAQHEDTPAGIACWLVMKKGVGARYKPYDAQVAWIQSLPGGYEARTSILHLATVVFTRHVITGERHLGDQNGQEGYSSYARCQELVHHSMFDRSSPLAIGGWSFFPRCLNVVDGSGYDRVGAASVGVVALRKF